MFVSQSYQKPARSGTLTCYEGVKNSPGMDSKVSMKCPFAGGYCQVGKWLKETESMNFLLQFLQN